MILEIALAVTLQDIAWLAGEWQIASPTPTTVPISPISSCPKRSPDPALVGHATYSWGCAQISRFPIKCDVPH